MTFGVLEEEDGDGSPDVVALDTGSPANANPSGYSLYPDELEDGGPNPDSIDWRREYNIAKREDDWKRRQDELMTQKRVNWEASHQDKSNRIAAAREAAAQRVLQERIKKDNDAVECENRDRCRDVAIQKRIKEWEIKSNAELVASVEDVKVRRQDKLEHLQACRQQIFDAAREGAHQRAEAAKCQAKVNARRLENIEKEDLRRAEQGKVKCQAMIEQAIEVKEEKIAKRPHRPPTIRCVLVQPERKKSVTEVNLEEKREKSLVEKAYQRNMCELARVRAAQEKHRDSIKRFSSTLEHCLGQQPIFT